MSVSAPDTEDSGGDIAASGRSLMIVVTDDMSVLAPALRAWSQAGLLRDVLLCPRDSLAAAGDEAACEGNLSGTWGRVGFLRALDHARTPQLVIISLRPDIGDPDFDAERLFGDDERVLESISRRYRSLDVRVRSLTVSILDDDAFVGYEAFSPQWDMHLIHDREVITDGSLPSRSVRGDLRRADRATLCAMTALTAVGGWTFTPAIRVEPDRGDATVKSVRIVRPQLRVVFAGPLLSEASEGLLPVAPPWPLPEDSHAERAQAGAVPPPRTASEICESLGLVCQPFTPAPRSRTSLGLRWRAAWRALLKGVEPLSETNEAEQELEDLRARLETWPSRVRGSSAEQASALARELERSGLSDLIGGTPAEPVRWGALRMLAFSLVDGGAAPSELSADVTLLTDSSRSRLLWPDPASIAADPRDSIPAPAALGGPVPGMPADHESGSAEPPVPATAPDPAVDAETAAQQDPPDPAVDAETAAQQDPPSPAVDAETAAQQDPPDPAVDAETAAQQDPPSPAVDAETAAQQDPPSPAESGSAGSDADSGSVEPSEPVRRTVGWMGSALGWVALADPSEPGASPAPTASAGPSASPAPTASPAPAASPDMAVRRTDRPAASAADAADALDSSAASAGRGRASPDRRIDEAHDEAHDAAPAVDDSLLGRVRAGLSSAMDEALSHCFEHVRSPNLEHSAYERAAKEAAALHRARRWLASLMLIVAVILVERLSGAIGMVVRLAGSSDFDTRSSAPAIEAAIGLAVLSALAIVLMARALSTGTVSLRHYDLQRQRRWHEAAGRHSAVELARLCSASVEFEDHARIIATMLHRPYSAGSPESRTRLEAEGLPHPASMVLAHASAVPQRLAEFRRRERALAVQPGWISRLFASAHDYWSADFESAVGGRFDGPDADHTPPGLVRYRDARTGEPLPGAREHFARAIEDDDGLRRRVTAETIGDLLGGDLSGTAQHGGLVRGLSELLGSANVPDAPALDGVPTLSFLDLSRESGDVDWSVLGPGAKPPEVDIRGSQSPVEVTEQTGRPETLIASWRLLISHPLEAQSLRCWNPDATRRPSEPSAARTRTTVV
ncbi:hypothetical protein [Candidatus Poriferisodalis sp.]|uniref:hypothetical protein n=1 Tax=Candidatus Poriferisodalis sp. TaxID=3101277 RepID=UPI003B018BE9